MEALFGNPAYKGFVLQDVKRLPGRFFCAGFRLASEPTALGGHANRLGLPVRNAPRERNETRD